MAADTKQSGFSIVGILIVVAIIGVIAGIGVVVTNRNTKTAPATANESPTPTTPKDQNTTPKGGEATTNGTVLTLKEWGVQIPLSDSIKDAYYVVSTSTAATDGAPNAMLIGRTAFDKLGCKASDANSGKTPIGQIIRVMPDDKDPIQGTPYTELYPGGVTIDNYYYVYVSWIKSNTCVPKADLQSFDTAMSSAVKASTVIDAQAANTPN